MSAATYHEPYRLPAGILTLAVHGVFFALLFLGFKWQTLPPAAMQVELWDSLPEELEVPKEAAASTPAPKVEESMRPPAEKIEKMKAPEIALPDKKKIKPTPVEKKPEKKKPEKKKPVEKPVAAKPQEVTKQEANLAEQQAMRERAEKAAAIDKVVSEFQEKIRAKIRRNIRMPEKVPDDAVAIFRVTLLPGGSVLPPRLVKSSGNSLYDSAVERAILKSDPLPLPEDVTLFNKFRELELKFRPKD